MARIGTSTNYCSTTTNFAVASFNTWSFHLWVRGGAVPGNSRFTYGVSIRDNGGGSSNPDFGFEWDHSSSTFQQSVINRRASNAYDSAKLATSLAANTWYAVGGSMDGSNLRAYLNGALETTVTSAAPEPTRQTKANVLVQQANTAANPWTDGQVAELGVWSNTVLTADQFAALGKGFSPLDVAPAGLITFERFIRNNVDWRDHGMTDGGASAAYSDHPPVF